MGRAEISYKQTSKSAAELKGNKKKCWLGPGLCTHGYLSKLDFFWPSQFMWGKSTPALHLVYIFFALHHASEAHERVPGQHAAGVRECICNLANMVNYTNIACVDAPVRHQHIGATTQQQQQQQNTRKGKRTWKFAMKASRLSQTANLNV